ncbi:hypothetical protein C8Q70DRAFT_195638 [Cubamyces menziesii]|uniref:Aminoglycoside phosphotransferase domain-containing protein n=1 Tax=Trametes cubensis TaxID=1111947 RepID=A0AAD7XAL2_9APHY|nr:hypothetical protein C8Q70DRAFT_195638 [Cubamyces menziesii]KAJ8487590.1 hypothetical protein ONZ51_g4087 [Trametes cubensis]
MWDRYARSLNHTPRPQARFHTQWPWIGGLTGSAFSDFMMTSESTPFVPFANEREFNDWRVSRFRPFGDRHAPTAARIADIRKSMHEDHPIVYTHDDINRRNILVRVHGDGPDDVEITALLDWEQARWRPIYWESRKWHFEDWHTPVWGDFGLKVIGQGYETVVELDRKPQKTSGHVPY